MVTQVIERIPETRSLPELEAVIARGLATFVDVGTALLEIREGRLYRETHRNFESYCQERWGFSRDRGDQLIAAAEVVAQLPTMVGNSFPINERHARELARIPADERAEVWQRVVSEHGERVTAQHIREVRSEESPAHDPPLLSIVDLETGEVVRPDRVYTPARPKTEAEQIQERREEVTRTFVKTFSLLASLLPDDQDQIAEMWEPAANSLAHVAPLAHLWTADGIREVARRLDRLANEVELRGGSLQ